MLRCTPVLDIIDAYSDFGFYVTEVLSRGLHIELGILDVSNKYSMVLKS